MEAPIPKLTETDRRGQKKELTSPRALALAKFTPIHNWEGGELESGQKRYFLGK